MSRETEVILKTLLFQAYKAETIKEMREAIEVMCTKEEISDAKQKLLESRKSE
jgi:hypothetical protein